jgi:hypothetical protein
VVRALIVSHDTFSSFLDANHACRRVLTQRWSEVDTCCGDARSPVAPSALAVLLLDSSNGAERRPTRP